MPYKARCNGCGYDGGPKGDDWQATSGMSWGRCSKCGTTNLEVAVFCDTCGTKETVTYGSMTRCLKCYPEPSHSK